MEEVLDKRQSRKEYEGIFSLSTLQTCNATYFTASFTSSIVAEDSVLLDHIILY